uniref:Beta-1,4 N-acetylgalactosaminyltransferase 1 (Trinotate prediction) n=1 Tax=Myxobolus squamalis TaxID=59785 RepID=A0A6B2FWU6_MYXSQ
MASKSFILFLLISANYCQRNLISPPSVYGSSKILNTRSLKQFKWDDSKYNASKELEYCGEINIADDDFFSNSNSCTNHTLCGLNTRNEITYEPKLQECKNSLDCVTAVVKTAGERDHKILTLIESAWKFYPELKFIIISDDRIDQKIDPKLQKYMNDVPEKLYFKIFEPIVGLAHGRMIGLGKVKTPYVLLMDDDFEFTKKTDIDKLLNVLMSTSASLVGGTTDKCNFFGLVRFYQKDRMNIFEHTENYIHGNLKNHQNCLHVDIAKNFFVARLEDVLQVGGWNKRLVVAEHEDLFIKLKLNGKSVVICPEVHISHRQENDRIRTQRKYSFKGYKKILKDFWKIDQMIFVTKTK